MCVECAKCANSTKSAKSNDSAEYSKSSEYAKSSKSVESAEYNESAQYNESAEYLLMWARVLPLLSNMSFQSWIWHKEEISVDSWTEDPTARAKCGQAVPHTFCDLSACAI